MVDHFQGGYRMNLPGGGAPVAGPTRGCVDGLGEMFGVEEQPTADAHPASVEMVAQSGC